MFSAVKRIEGMEVIGEAFRTREEFLEGLLSDGNLCVLLQQLHC